MKEYAKSFYKSKRWQKCRKAYIDKRIMIDGGMCEECGVNLGFIVHHIIPLNENNINDSAVTLNPEHFMYVCKSCHDKYDGHWNEQRKHKETVVQMFDTEGQLLPPKKIQG